MPLYPNRSDLATQAAAAPKGQQYGQSKRQLEGQRVQPVAGSPRPSVSGQVASSNGLNPGEIPSLSDPSAMPHEPLTAGLPSGPGPGPSALKSASFGPQELSIMRAIYLKYPNEDIRRLIEWTENNLA